MQSGNQRSFSSTHLRIAAFLTVRAGGFHLFTWSDAIVNMKGNTVAIGRTSGST